MRQMDSFRGSVPPKFISFHLGNQIPEEDTSTNSAVISPPATTDSIVLDPQTLAEFLNSPQNTDGEQSVNAATATDGQNLGSRGPLSQPGSETPKAEEVSETTTAEVTHHVLPPITTLRTSTPVPTEDGQVASTSLAVLESGLRVVETSSSQLPELLPTTPQRPTKVSEHTHQTDDDYDSSVYEVPALPSGTPKVRFLTDLSGTERTIEETSSIGQLQLYGHIPNTSESGTETGVESTVQIAENSQQGPNATTSRGSGDALPELSVRARAILRTYFDEARALELPPGHFTGAFTEPQVYHLLRVLTDETLRMSYDTMEKMVLDAVRGKPATAPSRTAHFYKRSRAATPYRGVSSDSSDVEEGGDPNVDTHGQDSTDQ